MTVEELKTAFVFAYHQKADAIYFLPGKITLLGDHIIANNNSPISCTLSNGIYLLLSRNNENCIKFWSLNEPEAINWNINQPIPKNINSWVKYPITIIKQLVEMGYQIDSGYDLLFWGNVPNGAALSKMEGLELITTFALKNQFHNCQNPTLNQQPDNHCFSYINCNILPVELVFETSETFHKKTEGYKVVISNTHTPHKVDVSAYYQRIVESKQAVEYLNKIQPIHNWDKVTEEDFNSLISAIDNPVAIKSVYHMISEIHRTKVAIKIIKECDLVALGQLMNASHISLRDNLQIVSPEVDAMVAEALKTDGVIGSRMAGCGFGGCTISLVKEEAVNTFVDRVGRVYEEETGITNHFYIGDVGDYAYKLY